MKYSSVKFRQRYIIIIKTYKWHDLGSELKFLCNNETTYLFFFRKEVNHKCFESELVVLTTSQNRNGLSFINLEPLLKHVRSATHKISRCYQANEYMEQRVQLGWKG